MVLQIPDWLLDPRFLTSLILGLVGTISAVITIYKTVKERQIQSLRTAAELLSQRKEELVEAISRETRAKYLTSELAAMEDTISDLLMRRQTVRSELQEAREICRAKFSQHEIDQLRDMLQTRDRLESRDTGRSRFEDIWPLAVSLIFGTWLPFGNIVVLPLIMLQRSLSERKRRKNYEKVLESL